MSAELAREQAVRTLVVRIDTIDTRRWADLRSLYADEVTTDYSSLFGGDAQRQSGDPLIAALVPTRRRHSVRPTAPATCGRA